jgi:hypothetical protein
MAGCLARDLLCRLQGAYAVGVVVPIGSQGRARQVGKGAVAAIVAAVALARIYLAVDTPTGVVVASIIGVTVVMVVNNLQGLGLVPG